MNCSVKFTVFAMMILLVLFVSSMGLWGILAYAVFSYPLGIAVLMLSNGICRENYS